MPPTHCLLGGQKGAAEWLERFLESLPPPPTAPLPLLTAPVLHAFLSGAGCMLADKYESLFKKSLQTISEDILDRLDQGAIGKPSFIRLSKTMEKGYNGFRSTLPPKAIPEMYNSSINTGIGKSGGMHGHNTSSRSFGGGNPSTSTSAAQSNPFGSSSVSPRILTNNNAVSNPFGSSPIATPNSFGRGSSRDQMNQFNSADSNTFAKATSFGFGSQDTAPSTSGWASTGNKASGNQSFGATFGNIQSSNPFAAEHAGNTQEKNAMSSSTSFSSSNQIPNQIPTNIFGSINQVPPNTTPFGSSNQVQTSTTPFGSSNQVHTNTTPFGSSNQVHTNTTPFGSSSHLRTNAAPFGSSNQAQTSTAPFGSSTQGKTQTRASAFGSRNRTTTGASAFGSSNQATTGSSPFGANSGNNNKKNIPPCKFFLKGQCRFGDKCKFSHDIGNSSSVFSWNNNNNNSNRNAPFGGGFSSNQRNPFA
ncbi:unnamed protein product [Cylindrotheca closterium]|nr:unnamed protein product [Cylindrotheca closterium]